MKLRHIIMIIVLIIAISVFIDSKGTTHMTCTSSGTLYDSPSVSTLEISVQNNTLKNINITVDITLNEDLKAQKNYLIEMIKVQGKSEVTETKDGLRLTSGMNGSYFTSLGLKKDITYSELKEVLELQDFACK